MSMKKSAMIGLMSMLYASSMDGMSMNSEETRKRKEKREIKKVIPKGLKRFEYGVNHLYASNQKVADKKANKLGWVSKDI